MNHKSACCDEVSEWSDVLLMSNEPCCGPCRDSPSQLWKALKTEHPPGASYMFIFASRRPVRSQGSYSCHCRAVSAVLSGGIAEDILPFLGRSCDTHGCRRDPPIFQLLHRRRAGEAQISYPQVGGSGHGHNR